MQLWNDYNQIYNFHITMLSISQAITGSVTGWDHIYDIGKKKGGA